MRKLIFIVAFFFVSANASAKEYWAYSKDGVNLLIGTGLGSGTVMIMDNHLGKEPLRFDVNQLKFTLDNGNVESPCCAVTDNRGRLDLVVGAGGAVHYFILTMPQSMDRFQKQQILLPLRGDDDPWAAAFGGVGLSMQDAIAKLSALYFETGIKEISLGDDIKFKKISEAELLEILAPLRDL